MPQNKNASYRYRLIDECLRNRGRKWALADLRDHISHKLMEEFDAAPGPSGYAISDRQLLDDIALMRKSPPEGYGAPIVRQQGAVYYGDKEFSIHQRPLIQQDLDVLTKAAALLRQFSAFPHHRELEQLLQKLLGRVQPTETLHSEKSVIQFEKNDFLQGAEFLAPLYERIRQRQPILLTYRPFRPPEVIRTIFHPYLLKAFNNRWFVIGWDQAQQDIRNYALDRIQAFDNAQAAWFVQPGFDPDTYFADVVGVSVMREEKVEEIIIEATAEQAMYIKTKPIHPSQRTVGTQQGWTSFSLRLIPNYELQSILLSFGEKVKVLKPESLRTAIRERLAASLHGYEGPGGRAPSRKSVTKSV